MIDRSLFSIAFSPDWGRQMRFITGPRQSGKTTLSKKKLKKEKTDELYYLWDSREVRKRYKDQELFFTSDIPPSNEKKHWVCFDEIHKMPKWKNILKGIFDETEDYYRFIITGSAKFNITKRAGDSLAGRFFTFHLFPLTFNEVLNRANNELQIYDNPMDLILHHLNLKNKSVDVLDQLLEYSGFPEPFLHQSKAFYNKWSQDYMDRVIKEDIGILTRITDRDKLYDLYNLLPDFVGSPLSENSVASHLETNPVTIKNYLKKLQDFYLVFRIPPYSKNIKRALLKASKYYLYDWARIEDKYIRFENFIAVQLLTKLSLWEDKTGIKYSLSYIRDKNKKETDFLILKQKKPWLMVEVKYSDCEVEKHHLNHSQLLGSIPVVQVCYENGIASQQKKNTFRMSASRFLSG